MRQACWRLALDANGAMPATCALCRYAPQVYDGVPGPTICQADQVCWRAVEDDPYYSDQLWEYGQVVHTRGAAYTAPMAEQVAAAAASGNGAPAGDGRMWRKVVAFRHDQKAALQVLAARLLDDEQGNVSAVIRDAVDEYMRRHLPIREVATHE